ncbi:hypothetical protein FKM82_029321, partial [Ascaphus truei]
TVKRPRKIQVPINNSVHLPSMAPSYSSRTTQASNAPSSDPSPREDEEEPDSPLPWRGRHDSTTREPPDDTARGYEGDSSSGRSSVGSRTPSSRHTTHRRTRGSGSEAGGYPRRRGAGSETGGYPRRRGAGSDVRSSGSGAGGYPRRRETGSEVGDSVSEVDGYPNGLELMSGFKRLPIQDVPSKPVKAVLVKRAGNQEYGLKLGSQIFIKHITESGLAAQESSLQEGDLILKINGVTSENMSLVDTRRLIERSKGKLTLTVLRDNRQFLVNIPQVRDSESEARSSPPDGKRGGGEEKS